MMRDSETPVMLQYKSVGQPVGKIRTWPICGYMICGTPLGCGCGRRTYGKPPLRTYSGTNTAVSAGATRLRRSRDVLPVAAFKAKKRAALDRLVLGKHDVPPSCSAAPL